MKILFIEDYERDKVHSRFIQFAKLNSKHEKGETVLLHLKIPSRNEIHEIGSGVIREQKVVSIKNIPSQTALMCWGMERKDWLIKMVEESGIEQGDIEDWRVNIFVVEVKARRDLMDFKSGNLYKGWGRLEAFTNLLEAEAENIKRKKNQ